MTTTGIGVWRLHWKWWVPALVFFVANLLLLSADRLVLAGQAQLRASRIQRSQEALIRLADERKALEQNAAQVKASSEELNLFYGERLSSENVRLTDILREVRDMATRAGLAPKNINYGKEEIDDHGLLRRSLEFAVEGSYLEFRRFVNLLELSDSFLVLERVGLRDTDDSGSNLRIGLRVSTLFTREGVDGAPERGDTS
jgi:hypothetical protein